MRPSSFFTRTRRVLEPESMDGETDVRVYDRVAQSHAFLDRSFVRMAVRLGAKEARVLDVGCGSGRVPILLARAADARVVGVDTSARMLELARENAAASGAATVSFLVADGRALPFADGAFDVVLSHHTLHHLPDASELIREMQRVLRSGGALFVRDLRRPDHAGVIDLYLATAGRIYDRLGSEAAFGRKLYRDSLAAAYSRDEWRALASDCGIPTTAVRTRWVTNHQDLFWRKAS